MAANVHIVRIFSLNKIFINKHFFHSISNFCRIKVNKYFFLKVFDTVFFNSFFQHQTTAHIAVIQIICTMYTYINLTVYLICNFIYNIMKHTYIYLIKEFCFLFQLNVGMQNEIMKFMQIAVADQITTAGESVVITRVKEPGVKIYCKAVITSRDGSYDAEVGGVQYSVSGHALIQKNSVAGGEPQAGDRLTQETGEKWLLTNTISSSNDAAISCDLVRLV